MMADDSDSNSTQPPSDEVWPIKLQDSQIDSPPSWFDSNNYDPLSFVAPRIPDSEEPLAGCEPILDSEAYRACDAQLIHIRQKQEDLTKCPIYTSYNSADVVTLTMLEGRCPLYEVYISSLTSQLEETHNWIKYLDEENRILSSKLQSRDSENKVLQKRLNDLEQEVIPSLKRARADAAIEKDAAIVYVLQKMKKHLKEAEEERCRIWFEKCLPEFQARARIPTDKFYSRGGDGSEGNI